MVYPVQFLNSLSWNFSGNIQCNNSYTRRPLTDIDLAVAITPDAMIPILANPQIQQQLLPFLPEGESLPKTEEELRNTVKSPQFKQVCVYVFVCVCGGDVCVWHA